MDRNRRLLQAALVLLSSALLTAQDRTADQGVYTSAQASRGLAVFDAHCVSCHRESGTAPVLSGERFTKSFADSTLQAVFTTVQTTMPRTAPGSLSEGEYVDIVAHLLRLNGFPDGMSELTHAGLMDIKIPGQGGSLEFALVQVAGCLSQSGRTWVLGRASDPVRTRAPEAASDQEAAPFDQAPPGARRFRLQQVYGAPSGWTGQKVAVKGFFTRSGTEERINVTSIKTLTSLCAD